MADDFTVPPAPLPGRDTFTDRPDRVVVIVETRNGEPCASTVLREPRR
jgi:hypothetical protein